MILVGKELDFVMQGLKYFESNWSLENLLLDDSYKINKRAQKVFRFY